MNERKIRSYNRELEELNPTAVCAFDDEFGYIGARLAEREGDLQWFRLRYWDYAKKLRMKPLYTRYLKQFHFDFIERQSLNAIASSRDEVGLVACHSGSFDNIASFFTLLLSHPKVLPGVGDPSREKDWILSLKDCDWSASWSAILENIDMRETPPPNYPIDPDRALFAHSLAILAMDFLFFHEIGHLVGGHLEFLRGDAKVGGLEEVAFNARSRLTPLDYQALELNADSHAVVTMTREWFMLPDILPESWTFTTATEAIESLVLAMLSLFIMFDRTASSVKYYDSARHPHPAVRLANVFHGTCQLAKRHGPETLKKTESAWALGFDRAFQMCSRLGVGASVWHVAEYEMEAVFESFDRTAKHFQVVDKQLRPDLKRG